MEKLPYLYVHQEINIIKQISVYDNYGSNILDPRQQWTNNRIQNDRLQNLQYKPTQEHIQKVQYTIELSNNFKTSQHPIQCKRQNSHSRADWSI